MEPDIDQFCRTLVHETADAIVPADAEGLIRLWNKGAERVFGFSAYEGIGQSLDIIIPERLRAHHGSGCRAPILTGKSRYGAGDLLRFIAVRTTRRRLIVLSRSQPVPTGSSRAIAAA